MLARVRLVRFEEGPCAQALHIGPYGAEPETIRKMRDFMAETGLWDNTDPKGKHYEIYALALPCSLGIPVSIGRDGSQCPSFTGDHASRTYAGNPASTSVLPHGCCL